MPKLRCQCGSVLLYKPEQGGGIATCPKCSSLVKLPGVKRPVIRLYPEPPAAPADKAASAAQARPKFRSLIGQSFRCPFQPVGLAMWLFGLIGFTAAHYATILLAFLPVVGWFAALMLYIGLLGYFTGYAARIMWASAKGKWEMPPWPEMSNTTQNVFTPFLYLLAGAAVSVGPFLVYHLASGGHPKWSTELELLAGGMIYLPMSLLCVALAGLKALSPLVVLRAIVSAPLKYAVVWAVAVLLAALQAFGGRLADQYVPLPILARILQEAASLYLLFVMARLLGFVYYTSRDKMRWLVSDTRVKRSSGPETIE